jgi:hypothetical protein
VTIIRLSVSICREGVGRSNSVESSRPTSVQFNPNGCGASLFRTRIRRPTHVSELTYIQYADSHFFLLSRDRDLLDTFGPLSTMATTPPTLSASPTSTPSCVQELDDVSRDNQADTSTALPSKQRKNTKSILWKLYLSHTLSTWNARAFEFSAVIFLATIFPGTLFYASTYALFHSLAAFLLSSWIGQSVDTRERLWVVRQTILWQRYAVACSCLFLVALLKLDLDENKFRMVAWFSICVMLACIEKLALVGNTIAVERDWAVAIADSLRIPREDINSGMRRIDLVCKLVAPLCISLVDGYSTKVAIWVVFGQNAFSLVFVSGAEPLGYAHC